VKELDITKDGWPVAHPKLSNLPSAKTMIPWPSSNSYLSTYGLTLVCLIPGIALSPVMSISLSKCPIFPTIALFFINCICLAIIISLFPVAVIKTSIWETTFSILTTCNPYIQAYKAQIGSISVT